MFRARLRECVTIKANSAGKAAILQRIELFFYQWKKAAGHEPIGQSATSANDDLELRPVQRADRQQRGGIACSDLPRILFATATVTARFGIASHVICLPSADGRSATGAIQTLISRKPSSYVGRDGTPRFAEPGLQPAVFELILAAIQWAMFYSGKSM